MTLLVNVIRFYLIFFKDKILFQLSLLYWLFGFICFYFCNWEVKWNYWRLECNWNWMFIWMCFMLLFYFRNLYKLRKNHEFCMD